MKVIFLLILNEMSEVLKVKFILYILNEMSLAFQKELINIFVHYGRNTENFLKKG